MGANTTAAKLTKLKQTKADIKAAIEAKGQTVGEIPFSQYAGKIQNISGSATAGLDDKLNNANYSGVSTWFETFVDTSYEITKDWTDYSKVRDSKAIFVPTFNAEHTIKLPENASNLFRNSSVLTLPNVDAAGITHFWYTCYDCFDLMSITFKNFDASTITSYLRGFGNCVSLKEIKGFSLNGFTGKVQGMFDGCSNLEIFPDVDLSTCTEVVEIMSDCFRLTEVPKINFSGCTVKIENNSIYRNNTLLTTYNVEGTINCNFQLRADSLTVDSIMTIINALAPTETTKTCRIEAVNVNKLTEEQKAIATSKGWTLI